MGHQRDTETTEIVATKPGDDFVAQVKDALEHLYDLRYLEQHPLAAAPQGEAAAAPDLAGQRLRRELAATIESLSPGPGASFRAPQARAYNLLTMHYVEGMTVQEAAFKLGSGTHFAAQANFAQIEDRLGIGSIFFRPN